MHFQVRWKCEYIRRKGLFMESYETEQREGLSK